jgi:hypothetical protein
MRSVVEQQAFGWETEATRWCTPDQVLALIGESPIGMVRLRDLADLQVALDVATQEGLA